MYICPNDLVLSTQPQAAHPRAMGNSNSRRRNSWSHRERRASGSRKSTSADTSAYAVAEAPSATQTGVQPAVSAPNYHTDSILSIAATGEPHSVLSGAEDKLVALYDWKAARVKSEWSGHERGINKVTYCLYTRTAFSGSRDKTIRLWRAETPASASVLKEHTLTVTGLAISDDGQKLASGSRDAYTCLWDVQKSVLTNKRQISQNVITHMKWIPNEANFLQSSEDLYLRVWDSRTIEVAQSLPGHTNIQTCCDVTTDGKYFVTSSHGFDGNGCDIKLWDRRQGRILREFSGHQQSAGACAFVTTDQSKKTMIISGSADRHIKVWDFDRPDAVCSVETATGLVTSIASAHPDSEASFYSSSFEQALYAWKLDDSGQLRCLFQSSA